MSSEWPSVRLGDSCLKIGSGATPRGGQKSYLDDGPVALIRSQNVYNAGFQPEGLAYISDEQAAKLDNVVVEPGDVLVNITGDSVARVCSAPGEVLPARVNQHVAIIRPRPDLFDARYLRYFFVSPHQQALLLSMAGGGGTRKALTKGMLESLRVPLPPIRIQRIIVEPLELIDRAIAVYRSKNTTLELIAQAIFKSWFIDFDPVHAKAAGREPTGMDAETAALFPSEFEDSELGPIPKGWRVEPIKSLCERISNGGTPLRRNAEFWDGGSIPWLRTGELIDGFLINSGEYITPNALENTSVKLFPRHTVLMAIYAAPTVGRLGILTQDATFNQACTGLIAKPKIQPWFLYQTLFHGRDWFNNRANGAAQQNISKAIVESYPCVVPSPEVLSAYNSIAEHLYAAIENYTFRIETLTALRDTLLPRLISGRLRIPEAEEMVQEAVS